ncbi:hypothetical protein BDK51DRAFT_52027 [Blyttiomyces helicus]|uniref:RING-type domain-containing protein n=1 Tax=Blyttiomyces helicus TaxID=388810 RepID=A0A4V1IPP1_9FUNG|nr:hypothetical protein BDK51DRAFT_52027 [Blyttiomyces helicus]|eukprot:RKO83737.1 hypothetical protein BDK51DRAFT_52027 [Blyttiomyces helicus]
MRSEIGYRESRCSAQHLFAIICFISDGSGDGTQTSIHPPLTHAKHLTGASNPNCDSLTLVGPHHSPSTLAAAMLYRTAHPVLLLLALSLLPLAASDNPLMVSLTVHFEILTPPAIDYGTATPSYSFHPPLLEWSLTAVDGFNSSDAIITGVVVDFGTGCGAPPSLPFAGNLPPNLVVTALISADPLANNASCTVPTRIRNALASNLQVTSVLLSSASEPVYLNSSAVPQLPSHSRFIPIFSIDDNYAAFLSSSARKAANSSAFTFANGMAISARSSVVVVVHTIPLQSQNFDTDNGVLGQWWFRPVVALAFFLVAALAVTSYHRENLRLRDRERTLVAQNASRLFRDPAPRRCRRRNVLTEEELTQYPITTYAEIKTDPDSPEDGPAGAFNPLAAPAAEHDSLPADTIRTDGSLSSVPADTIPTDVPLPSASADPAPPDEIDPDSIPACAICLEPFESPDRVRSLPCSHFFHVPCIDRWLTEKTAACPLCRISLKKPGAVKDLAEDEDEEAEDAEEGGEESAAQEPVDDGRPSVDHIELRIVHPGEDTDERGLQVVGPEPRGLDAA